MSKNNKKNNSISENKKYQENKQELINYLEFLGDCLVNALRPFNDKEDVCYEQYLLNTANDILYLAISESEKSQEDKRELISYLTFLEDCLENALRPFNDGECVCYYHYLLNKAYDILQLAIACISRK